MITPQFEVKQTDEEIVLIIRVPCVRLSSDSEPEIHVDSYTVTFYASPYYLRLTFPGELVYSESDESGDSVKMEYDANTGCFTMKVKKAVSGEYFPDLTMLTKLLAKPKVARRPLIEEVGGDGETEEAEEAESEEDEDEDDFYIEQEEPTCLLNGSKYGFANQRSGVLSRLQSELWEVFDIKDPDMTPEHARRKLRVEDEILHFSDEHYLADLYDDEAIRPLLRFETNWAKERKKIEKTPNYKSNDELSLEEREILLKLPRKKFLLNSKESKSVTLSLVDILFAYAYNHRTTEGENTVSSGWTVCKLSATLSWLDTFHKLPDVVRSCFQRSLSYPLYRNWQLSEKVLYDVKDILASGKTNVLRCLLNLHQLLIDADQHYILNDLYISDYCVWIQYISNSTLEKLMESLKKVTVEKSDLDLDLLAVEEAGKLAIQEAEKTEDQDASDTSSATDSSDEDSDEEDSSDQDSDDQEDDQDDDQIETHDRASILSRLKDICILEQEIPDMNPKVQVFE